MKLRYSIIISAAITLIASLPASFAAPGDTVALPGTAITSLSAEGGEVRAKSAKATIHLRYSGSARVTADPPTSSVTFYAPPPLEACVDVFDGAPGEPGPANELTIGTVTTGEPGTSAAATITGTPPNQQLSFIIPKGDPGDPAAVDQATVFSVVDNKTSATMTLQGSSNSDVKLQLLYADSDGTSFWMSSDGSVSWLDQNGKEIWGYSTSSKTLYFSNYSYGSSRKSIVIDRFGQMRRYGADGRTLVYMNTTAGRHKFNDRRGRSVMTIYSGQTVFGG